MRHTWTGGIDEDRHETPSLPPEVELRQLYRRQDEEGRRTAVRQGFWVAVIVYLTFAVPDIILIPDVAEYTIAARIAIGVGALALFEVQRLMNVATEWLDRTCAFAVVLGYIGWMLPALMTSHTEAISYYMIFGAIFMMGENLFFSFRFSLSLAASGAILSAFLASLASFRPEGAYAFAFALFYVSCFVFTSYVNWKLNQERYNVFVNALEARIQHKSAAERGEALLKLSYTDPLTGLDNRRAVDLQLRKHWNMWRVYGDDFAVLLIDVDFFKLYNDRYGHQSGDRSLCLVADALRGLVEPFGGTVGRYGGEEFIAILRTNSIAHVEELSNAICRAVEELAIEHDQRPDGIEVVTASVGATFTGATIATKLEMLVREADRALYGAKAGGRHCAKVFDPNDPLISDESEGISALLNIAIGRNLVSLVYQPIRDSETGELVAAEALMRLNGLNGTPILPSSFIPIAERTGAIHDLGLWAIRTACEEMLAPNKAQLVSVNVSPVQLRAPGFAASVAEILARSGVSGNRLALEITEGLAMELHSYVTASISELRALGVQLWLDDFGTGHAGLSWLRAVDFHTVKIDRSFLHAAETTEGRAMLEDMVTLIRNRGSGILIEGVETEEQGTLARDLGIALIQGYHIGRPAPALQFAATDIANDGKKPRAKRA